MVFGVVLSLILMLGAQSVVTGIVLSSGGTTSSSAPLPRASPEPKFNARTPHLDHVLTKRALPGDPIDIMDLLVIGGEADSVGHPAPRPQDALATGEHAWRSDCAPPPTWVWLACDVTILASAMVSIWMLMWLRRLRSVSLDGLDWSVASRRASILTIAVGLVAAARLAPLDWTYVHSCMPFVADALPYAACSALAVSAVTALDSLSHRVLGTATVMTSAALDRLALEQVARPPDDP